MHPLVITPDYAAALAVLFLALSVRVIVRRRDRRIPFGSDGDAELERRVRVHANFAEYAPFSLLLLAMAELRGAPALGLHAVGVLVVGGRLVHAVGVSRRRTDMLARVVGMTLTQLGILAAAILLLVR
jgi:uncharacterized membrane protein YecN with MAPEG domain